MNENWQVSEPVSTTPNAFTITDGEVYIAEMFSLGADSNQAKPEDAYKNAVLMASAGRLKNALEEAIAGLHEALGDLTDHFTIKHVKGYLETAEEVLEELEIDR